MGNVVVKIKRWIKFKKSYCVTISLNISFLSKFKRLYFEIIVLYCCMLIRLFVLFGFVC